LYDLNCGGEVQVVAAKETGTSVNVEMTDLLEPGDVSALQGGHEIRHWREH